MVKIKVGYLLSYDYDMFLTSVKQLYDHVDKIVVGIDKDFRTWSGNTFNIEKSFFNDVDRFDVEKKIHFYYGDFYKPEMTPMQCELREREIILKELGNGGWKIQLDVDEYILNFAALKNYLNKNRVFTWFPALTPITLHAKYITLFKQTANAFLCIPDLNFPIITNTNSNTFARRNNDNFNQFVNIILMHQSWARTPEEIYKKVMNWGHRDDFDTGGYLNFWNSINDDNYSDFKNFHPLEPKAWPSLQSIPAKDIDQFLSKSSLIYKGDLYPLHYKSLIYFVIRKRVPIIIKLFFKKIICYNSNSKMQHLYRKLRGIEN